MRISGEITDLFTHDFNHQDAGGGVADVSAASKSANIKSPSRSPSKSLSAPAVIPMVASKSRFPLKRLRGGRRAGPQIEWCVKQGLKAAPGPKTALASFPGSGNTWLRYLLQQATGKKKCTVRTSIMSLSPIHVRRQICLPSPPAKEAHVCCVGRVSIIGLAGV